MNKNLDWKRVRSIARKEFFHIRRDKFTLAMALVLPAVIVCIFGFAIEFNLKEIPTAYVDGDKTPSSRQLLETLGSSHYFTLRPYFDPASGIRAIESERSKALVVIPPSFEKDMLSGRGAEVQVMVDAADGTSAGAILSHLSQLQKSSAERVLGISFNPKIQLITRFLYNPELNSQWFIVPGLAVVILALLSILLTALTVAREWESGSMELLLTTPVEPLELILGKLLPYGTLSMGGVLVVYILARTVFGIPFAGNHLVFLLGCLLFLATYLAQGLLISVVARKQMLAMQLGMLSGLLPSVLLSGFIFPIENMPVFFRYFTMILPARWFMVIARDSFLQGSTFWSLRFSFLALLVIGSIFILMAVKRFKRDVE